jgi:capsular polysaccharide biosynthesis protein
MSSAVSLVVVQWGVRVYFKDFMKVLQRRWYVLVVGLLVLAAAGLGVVKVVPTNYEASASVLFLLPPRGTTEAPVNPYLNTPSGLTLTALIIGGVLSTPEEQRSMTAAGFTSQFSVGQTPGSSAPLVYVTVEDTDPRMAVATLNEVLKRISAELKKMQDEAGAPRDQRMVAHMFSVTEQAEAVAGAKMRALAAVGGLGVVLTLVAAFAIDGSRLRKSSVRQRDQRRPAGKHAATLDEGGGKESWPPETEGPQASALSAGEPSLGGADEVSGRQYGRVDPGGRRSDNVGVGSPAP